MKQPSYTNAKSRQEFLKVKVSKVNIILNVTSLANA